MTTLAALAPIGRFRDVAAAEWIKLRAIRSARLTVLAGAAVTVAIGFITASQVVAAWPRLTPAQRSDLDPVALSLNGLLIAQLLFGVLGAVAVTSEHGTGMIRTTLTVVPRRGLALAAKATVVTAVAFLAAAVTSLAAFLATQSRLAERGLDVTLDQPGVLRALLGAAVFLAATTLVGTGLGALIRHTAGAVSALVGLLFVAPLAVRSLPAPWAWDVGRWLLAEAGRQAVTLATPAGGLSPGVAILVCAGYALLAVAAAGAVSRRDV